MGDLKVLSNFLILSFLISMMYFGYFIMYDQLLANAQTSKDIRQEISDLKDRIETETHTTVTIICESKEGNNLTINCN